MDRRIFQQGLLAGLCAIMGAAIGIPSVIYLFSTPKNRKGRGWTDAGSLSAVPLNKPEQVVFRRTKIDGWKVIKEKTTAWVIRKSPTDVVALAPQCTHLGCAYHWADEQKEFHCPCHTSAFTMEGKVLTGPAPRSLDRYDVKVENGRLLLGEIRRQA